MKQFRYTAICAILLAPFGICSASDLETIARTLKDQPPEVQLGARLFHDKRLSNPRRSLSTSCASCHVPPTLSDGKTQYTDGLARNLLPSEAGSGAVETTRNTPTLLDATLNDTFRVEEESVTLDEYLRHKLTSQLFGWAPDDSDLAEEELFAVLLNDLGDDELAHGTYVEHFVAALEVDVSESSEVALEATVTALTAYLDTIRTQRTSAYDAFAFLNRIPSKLAGPGDTPQALAGRIAGRIANQEGRVLIRFPQYFGEDAYQGYKTFMRVGPTYDPITQEMQESVGNCVACHVPPRFTDGDFRRTWPGRSPTDGKAAPFRVRTPGLRFIDSTGPYLWNGSVELISEAIRAHTHATEIDPDLAKIAITTKDIRQLTAFLHSLNEVPPEEFRDYRIKSVTIRLEPEPRN